MKSFFRLCSRNFNYSICKLKKLFRVLYLRILCPKLPLNIVPGAEHLHLASLESAPEFIVDAGFNKGQFSSLSLILWPSASVFAFDPSPIDSPKYASLLNKCFRTRFHFFPFALCEKSQTLRLNQGISSDNSSLLVPSEHNQSLFIRSRIVSHSIVESKPLSDLSFFDMYDLRNGLLKIDVQGYELNVLTGAKPILNRFAWLYIEVTEVEMYIGQALMDDILNWLDYNTQFNLVSQHNVDLLDGKLMYADLLFHAARQD